MSVKTKIFSFWRADDVTEWGGERNCPVIASSRDIQLFQRMYYALLEPESSLAYLAKQSGKALNEKKIPPHEDDKAKLLEITNLTSPMKLIYSEFASSSLTV